MEAGKLEGAIRDNDDLREGGKWSLGNMEVERGKSKNKAELEVGHGEMKRQGM